MNFMTINLKGAGGIHKPLWVKELKVGNKISFLALQETQMGNLPAAFATKFWDRSPLVYSTVDSVGRSGGLMSLWNPSVLSIESVVKNRWFILTSGVMVGSGDRLNILNVYAPSDHILRRRVWDEIVLLKNYHPGLWVALGDFNDVRSPEERMNSTFDHNRASYFNKFIGDVGFF